jgi:WD40 repeat protein
MAYKEIKGRVRLWRWRDGAEPETVIETTSLPLDAAYSPDGTRAAVVCAAGTILFLDPSTCAVLRSVDQAESRDIASEDWMQPRRLIRFSPTGRLFATFALGDLAQLWDGATGEPRGEPLRHSYVCYDVAFSPDGRLLATASFDNAARVWDTATGTLAGEPLAHSDWVGSVSFSDDGDALVHRTRDSGKFILTVENSAVLLEIGLRVETHLVRATGENHPS